MVRVAGTGTGWPTWSRVSGLESVAVIMPSWPRPSLRLSRYRHSVVPPRYRRVVALQRFPPTGDAHMFKFKVAVPSALVSMIAALAFFTAAGGAELANGGYFI